LLFCSILVAKPVLAGDPVDTDMDGIPNDWETVVYKTDPLKVDTDGDIFDDRTEIANGFDPLKKGNKYLLKQSDFDKDGLTDRLELLFRTDPTNVDTNGDGLNDGTSVNDGISPTSTTKVVMQKTIVINLAKQRLEPRLAGIALDSYSVSTGSWKTPTPPGTYAVMDKIPKAWSNASKLWMPWWMKFSNKGMGIHELPVWPSGAREGAWNLGRPVSHGCVRLGIGNAKKMYDWTPVGTPVIIVKK